MINRHTEPVDCLPYKSILSAIIDARILSSAFLCCSLFPVVLLAADTVTGTKIEVDVDGAVINAGVVLGAGAVAKQAIGDLNAGFISNDSVSVSLPSAVNVSATIAGYADSEQNIGVIDGSSAIGDSVTVRAKATMINAGIAVAGYGKTIQDVGMISSSTGAVVNSSVSVTTNSLVNASIGVGADLGDTEQKVGVIAAPSGYISGSKVTVDVLTAVNVAAGVGAAATAEQQIATIDGNSISNSSIQVTDSSVTNVSAGLAGGGDG